MLITPSCSARLTAVLALCLLTAAGFADDWPQWRGPNRDGIAASFKSPRQWPEKLKLRWKVNVGFGAASPVIAGNRAYLLTNQGQGEVVTAVNLSDG